MGDSQERAGVERAMGFAGDDEVEQFFHDVPELVELPERMFNPDYERKGQPAELYVPQKY